MFINVICDKCSKHRKHSRILFKLVHLSQKLSHVFSRKELKQNLLQFWLY